MFNTIKFTILFYLLLSICILNAQTTTFDFFVKTSATEGIGNPYENDDGYYYFIGGRYDTLSPDRFNDILLFKVNDTGDTISHLEHSQDTSAGLSCLVKTGDNFLGIGSYGFNSTSPPGGMYSIIFNTNLEILEKNAFSLPVQYYRYMSVADEILVDTDGNFTFIASLTEPYNNQGFDGGDICFYKFDTSGDTIGTRLFEMEGTQQIDAACFNGDTTEIWVFGSGFLEGVHQWAKFDMDFNFISTQEYFYHADYPFCIKQEGQNSWIGCGSFSVHNKAQDDDIWVFRMDSLGTIINDTTLGATDTIDYASIVRAIDFSDEGDIFVSGTHNLALSFYPNVTSWIMLTKLDNNFNHQFTRYYNPDDKYYMSIDIKVCSDGGVLLSNQRYDSENNEDPPYDLDGWILKVDGNGLMTGHYDKPTVKVKNALLYPNPGGNVLNISCGWPKAILTLYNLNGQPVKQQHLTSINTIIDVNFLPIGEYIWSITSSGNKIIENGKWIKNN